MGLRQPERVADREHGIADLHSTRIAEREWMQRETACGYTQHGEIVGGIIAEHARIKRPTVDGDGHSASSRFRSPRKRVPIATCWALSIDSCSGRWSSRSPRPTRSARPLPSGVFCAPHSKEGQLHGVVLMAPKPGIGWKDGT